MGSFPLIMVVVSLMSFVVNLSVVQNNTEFTLADQEDMDECGISVSQRIVGGARVAPGQYPWVARIMIYYKNESQTYSSVCTGSLINKLYVMSAAHCTQVPMIRVDVTLGTTETNRQIHAQNFRADVITILSSSCYNDISLIRLDRKAVYNTWVRPICLPDGLYSEAGYGENHIQVAGWGCTNLTVHNRSHNLYAVQLQLCTNCSDWVYYNTKFHLCAIESSKKGICYGDSGGPAMNLVQFRYVLAGVLYGKIDRGNDSYISYYTKVADKLNWIRKYVAI